MTELSTSVRYLNSFAQWIFALELSWLLLIGGSSAQGAGGYFCGLDSL